jgi:hypothetical protein
MAGMGIATGACGMIVGGTMLSGWLTVVPPDFPIATRRSTATV